MCNAICENSSINFICAKFGVHQAAEKWMSEEGRTSITSQMNPFLLKFSQMIDGLLVTMPL